MVSRVLPKGSLCGNPALSATTPYVNVTKGVLLYPPKYCRHKRAIFLHCFHEIKQKSITTDYVFISREGKKVPPDAPYNVLKNALDKLKNDGTF